MQPVNPDPVNQFNFVPHLSSGHRGKLVQGHLELKKISDPLAVVRILAVKK